MHIATILSATGPHFSFEFFPPKSEEASAALFQTIKELRPLEPAYVSVTYGAGGSTRRLTHDLVVRLHKESNLTIVSHLTCVGSTREEIGRILDDYRESGIENIMALRGDPPRGSGRFTVNPDGFASAAELVSFIKQRHPQMGIGVAGFPEGHPETPNRLQEMDYFKAKVDSGADYICTQMFFDNRDYHDFRERCELAGIHIPIIAGIMPITSRRGMVRMAELALGCRFPARLQKSIMEAADDVQAAEAGIAWATDQVRDLIQNDVAGIHFYTLNRSRPTLRIYESLGLKSGLRIPS